MDSGADNWEQKPYLPIYEQANWFADGERFELPEDFYSSRFLVDKTIEFIGSNLADGEPFFAYLPFQAVHIPVQAPQEFIDRNMGVYDDGWDVLREQRRARAVQLGLVPESAQLAQMASTGEWSALSAERQRYEAKRMAVYAGMIEAMDFHIGRLVGYLKAQGVYENTVIIVTSDNGAAATGPDDPDSFPSNRTVASLGYHQDYDRLGLKGSYNTIGPSFASAAVSPLSFYKFYTGEGGLRVPLIFSGKGFSGKSVSGNPVARPTSIIHAFSWATDITPTVLSLAGVEQPGTRYAGRPVLPITGKSLVPLLDGTLDRVYESDEAVGYELTGHAALFQGDYKLVRNMPPQGDGQWRLYNMAIDPGEVTNLEESEPARYEQMLVRYEQFEKDNRVMAVPEGYSSESVIPLRYSVS
jgi:arylsulfatase/uncharacterized sulfatase